ncbi:MAG: UDP-N-acetylglucosamine 2-epimerase (non-hydrolyzing) [Ignavibacteriae bacterium]|nr:UDP-N-acetylglucosamine 2-epimerase (non-hydrolyzing) [Ignavibacteriota bacterium]
MIHKIIHTDQHYDKKMSNVFFKELELPKPNIYLGVGSKSHAEQTAMIMIKLEKILEKEKPDLVLVYGDVNSTIAAGLVCAKIYKEDGNPIPIAHVESGLRSFDRKMPEEINRILTDNIAEYLFITEKSGYDNLVENGFDKKKIYFIGNTMIDSLDYYLKKSSESKILKELCVSNKSYALVTLHRPSNVDDKINLERIYRILSNINHINSTTEIVFPIHPRTLKMIDRFKLKIKFDEIQNLIITEPFGYIDFLELIKNAKYVLTDSGGIQEETTYLNVPCITLRDNTERPITITEGTNVLCGLREEKVYNEIKKIESGQIKKSKIPKFWDGKAAERIVKFLMLNYKL